MMLALTLFILALTSVAREAAADEGPGRQEMQNRLEDPCREKHCNIGHECDIDEDGRPICVCRRQCPEENDSRAKVCSTRNVTFASECEFHRQKCLCHNKHGECGEPSAAHSQLDYYGACKEFTACSEGELDEFPERMRDWFYRVMEELASRRSLRGYSRKMARQAEKRESRKWVLPVIWKFCDLDKTHDREVTNEELLPITAPLKPLEHCTQPFLEKCDENSNGSISLLEWGNCLGLEQDEIDDRCDAIQRRNDKDEEEEDDE